jgi:uncharacterized protein YggT (Ycf19 family)
MMAPSHAWLAAWPVQALNILLAAMAYALVARLLLSGIVSNGAWPARLLSSITNPILRPVAAVTPRVVPPPLVIVFAVAWLFAARLLLAFGATIAGLRSALG